MSQANLEHLISAYFYELWDQHEYASWQAAVDDFVHRCPERAVEVPKDVDGLLAEDVSDEELTVRLTRWGFGAKPLEGERAWLSRVKERIASDLADQ
jgi:CdiI immunity protein